MHVHLETPRLVLRRFTTDDADALVDLVYAETMAVNVASRR